MKITKEDDRNIRAIEDDKQQVITYRAWTRRVLKHVRCMRTVDDDSHNHNIFKLIGRLRGLEKEYTKAIVSVSLKKMAEKYEVNPQAIAESLKRTENKTILDNVKYAEAADLHVYLRRQG